MDKKLCLKIAAGWAFFMAACQTVISVWPAAAAYFMAPPSLLADRWQLFLWGEAAALAMVVAGLYALSGAGSVRRLPLLRLGLIVISSVLLLRGVTIVLDVLVILGLLAGELLVQGTISTLVFLSAGLSFAVGTILNRKDMRVRKGIAY